MDNFAVIDIIFVALIVIFMIRCAIRGFVSELMSVASVVLGFLAALYLYSNGGEFLRSTFMQGGAWHFPEIIAFIAIFSIVFIVVKIIGGLLNDIIEGVRLGGVDRFLGIFFGVAQGIAVVSLVLFILRIQPIFDSEPLLYNSFFARLLLPMITGIRGSLGV